MSTTFKLTRGLSITGVVFTRTAAAPTVTISGAGFASAPAGISNDNTPCGPYPNNGDDFGTNFSFTDAGNFTAGAGTPPNDGSCVGLVIGSWTDTSIVFQFGSAYNTFAHWYITAGDSFDVNVKGIDFTGTVGF